MVQFADSVVIIPDGLDPYTLPLHPDGTYVDGSESLSAESLGLDGLDNDASFQDAMPAEMSMGDMYVNRIDIYYCFFFVGIQKSLTRFFLSSIFTAAAMPWSFPIRF
jgi:hypothetical protein